MINHNLDQGLDGIGILKNFQSSWRHADILDNLQQHWEQFLRDDRERANKAYVTHVRLGVAHAK